jgi:SSS family solute:Na+ symporter
MNAALVVIGVAALAALALGVIASMGHEMGLEQWTVAGRGFGWVFVFLLLAGEIYTTFTFLGASGIAYGAGAPAYYIIAYGSLAYVLAYFMLPPVWTYAKQHGQSGEAAEASSFPRKRESRCAAHSAEYSGMPPLPHGFPLSRE